jgi:RNA polymerase sigma factor (sigma-70 family)
MPGIQQTHDGFRAGDAGAIAEVQGWIRQVVFGARWRIDDLEAAQQDALIELLGAVRNDRVRDPQAFQKFVWTVTKRVCLEHHRHGARRAESRSVAGEADDREEIPANVAAPEELLERSRELELLRYAYERLPDECRQLWRWVYGESWPAARVAEALAINVGAARVRVHRCLERARAYVDEVMS